MACKWHYRIYAPAYRGRYIQGLLSNPFLFDRHSCPVVDGLSLSIWTLPEQHALTSHHVIMTAMQVIEFRFVFPCRL